MAALRAAPRATPPPRARVFGVWALAQRDEAREVASGECTFHPRLYTRHQDDDEPSDDVGPGVAFGGPLGSGASPAVIDEGSRIGRARHSTGPERATLELLQAAASAAQVCHMPRSIASGVVGMTEDVD